MGFNLRLLPRYLLNLGLYRGVYYFIVVEFLNKSKFKLPGYKNTFYLRPSTTHKKVFREIFLFKSYAFPVVTSPSVIIDAGSNIGLSSIFFSRRFPGANIYSIEPETSNFEALKRNIECLSNITAIHTALWHKDAMLTIRDRNEHQWAFTVEECEASHPETFPAISVTSLMKKYGIEHIDLLKMDIEGSERELFSENYEYWLSRTKLLVVEVHDWMKPGCSAALFNAVSKYKIKTTIYEGMFVIEFNP